jgi:hypothetical protein
MTLLSEWIRRRNFFVRSKATAELDTILTDCQFDALRFLSSGPHATCGSNSTSYASCVPEKCRLFDNVSLDELLDNTDCKFYMSRQDLSGGTILDLATLTIPDTLYLNNSSGRDDIQRVSI